MNVFNLDSNTAKESNSFNPLSPRGTYMVHTKHIFLSTPGFHGLMRQVIYSENEVRDMKMLSEMHHSDVALSTSSQKGSSEGLKPNPQLNILKL